jgi:formyltetrahydrofolate hydrolase
MFELSVNAYLQKEDLFELFKQQLKKDFEGAGLNSDFTSSLPVNFEELKFVIREQLILISKHSHSSLNNLLYRVDISELQLQSYQKKNPNLNDEELRAELIIKRELQKIILKRNFS